MTSRDRWYRRVVQYIAARDRRCAYTSAVHYHLAQFPRHGDYDWTSSLLSEMREAGLVIYMGGWGWRLRRGAEERMGLIKGGDRT